MCILNYVRKSKGRSLYKLNYSANIYQIIQIIIFKFKLLSKYLLKLEFPQKAKVEEAERERKGKTGRPLYTLPLPALI